MAYGTSFPHSSQKTFESNRNLLKKAGVFDIKSNNKFINAPRNEPTPTQGYGISILIF